MIHKLKCNHQWFARRQPSLRLCEYPACNIYMLSIIVILLVWPTSWTPAIGGLFVCEWVCMYVWVSESVCPRTCRHIAGALWMADYEKQSGLICICGMERYIIHYKLYLLKLTMAVDNFVFRIIKGAFQCSYQSLMYVFMYNTIKWPYQPQHSPSLFFVCDFIIALYVLHGVHNVVLPNQFYSV